MTFSLFSRETFYFYVGFIYLIVIQLLYDTQKLDPFECVHFEGEKNIRVELC